MTVSTAGEWPRVSVIVPTYEDRDRLLRCVQALEEQDYPRDLFEVVVCDNGSRDGTAEALSGCEGVRVVVEPQPGSYRARNAGLAVASGEVLAFTDSDCLPDRRWLTAGVTALRAQRRPGLVAGRVDVFTAGPRPTAVEAYELLHAFPQERYAARGFGVTANLLTTREVFDEVGLFDAELQSGGDAEWGWRVSATGRDVTFCADAVVRHPARRTWAELRTKLARVMRGECDRRRAGGRPSTTSRELLRGLVPPVGAWGRARRSGRLDRRASLGYVGVEVLVRYVGTWYRFSVTRARPARSPAR